MTSRRVAILVAMLLLLATPLRSADEAPPQLQPIAANGFELFQAMLVASGVSPVTSEELNRGDVNHELTMLIVLGTDSHEFGLQFLAISKAAQFLRGGHPVLVASNESADLSAISVAQGRFPRHALRIIDKPEASSNAVLNARLEAPFNQLLAKTPSDPRPVQNLATHSAGEIQRLVSPPDVLIGTTPTDAATFAIGRLGPPDQPYRLLVLADQNVYSNGMLLKSDFDNWRFALNTIQFLKGPEKRTKCIFVHHGRLVEKFEFKFAPPSIPDVPLPLPSWREMERLLVDGSNRIMDRLQTEDTLNKIALGNRAETRERRLANFLGVGAVVSAVVAVFYLLRKVWNARIAQEPPQRGVTVEPLVSDTLIGRRSEELLRRNNFYELARAAIRDTFESAGVPATSGETPPAIEYPRGRQTRIAKAIRELWPIGFARSPQTITLQDWKKLEKQLDEVRHAASEGIWRFAAPRSVSE